MLPGESPDRGPRGGRPAGDPRARLRGNLLGAVAGLLFVVVWAPALRLGALSDDWELFEAVLRGGPLGMWTFPPTTFFRPVVSAVSWVDAVVWGDGWRGWHFANLVWHAANAALVALVAARLGVRAPAWAGLLFALWGTHVESVAWISGRTDLVATFFALLAVLGFLARSGAGYVVGTAALLVALGAKESAVALPLACLALAGHAPPGGGARAASWGAVVLGAWVARAVWLGVWIGGYGAAVHLPGAPVLLLDLTSLLWTLLLPNPDREPPGWPGWVAASGVALAAIAATVRVAPPAARPRVRALWTAAALLLLPVLGLRVDFVTGEGQRLVYTASAFAIVALVDAAAALGRWRHAGLAALLTIQVVVLRVHLADWIAAAAEARRVVTELRALPPDAPTPPVPDSIDGAYVFRNGAEAARRLAR